MGTLLWLHTKQLCMSPKCSSPVHTYNKSYCNHGAYGARLCGTWQKHVEENNGLNNKRKGSGAHRCCTQVRKQIKQCQPFLKGVGPLLLPLQALGHLQHFGTDVPRSLKLGETQYSLPVSTRVTRPSVHQGTNKVGLSRGPHFFFFCCIYHDFRKLWQNCDRNFRIHPKKPCTCVIIPWPVEIVTP